LVMRAMMTADASMTLAAERGALHAFVGGGVAMAARTASLEEQLATLQTPALKDGLSLELSAMIGANGGLTGVRSRITEVKNLMMVARFDAAGFAAVTRELNTLEALEKTLSSLDQRISTIA
jgi:hypothetical protein